MFDGGGAAALDTAPTSLLDTDRVTLSQLVDLLAATLDAASLARDRQITLGGASVNLLIAPLMHALRTRAGAEAQLRARMDAENGELKAVLGEMTALAHDQRLRLELEAAAGAELKRQLVRGVGLDEPWALHC